MSTNLDKLPREDAQYIAVKAVALLQVHCQRIEVAGSIRRQADYVGDIELVAIPESELLPFLDQLLSDGVIAQARYGESQTTRWGKKMRGFLLSEHPEIKIELYLAEPDTWGYIYWLRTGPGDGNRFVVTQVKNQAKFHVRKGAVWYTDQQISVPDETRWFSLLGLKLLEPERRTEHLYRRLLTDRRHTWPDPMDFLPRQGGLFDLGVFTDFEIGVRTAKDAKAGISKKRQKTADYPPLVWEPPLLYPDGRVWCTWVVHGQRQRALLPQDHPRAKQYHQYLSDHPWDIDAQIEDLQRWRKAHWRLQQHGDTVRIQGAYDLRALLSSYTPPDGLPARCVSLDRLIPSEDELSTDMVRRYIESRSITDDSGFKPLAIQPADSDRLFLIDGNHRWYAAKLLNEHIMTVEVHRVHWSEQYIIAESTVPSFKKMIDFMDILRTSERMEQAV